MGRQRELLGLSIILCMGLLFVMAGILLIVGKLAGKRPSSIAGGVLISAWACRCVPKKACFLWKRGGSVGRIRTGISTVRYVRLAVRSLTAVFLWWLLSACSMGSRD